MGARVTIASITLSVIVFIFLLLFTFFSQQNIKSAVDDLVYNSAESVSTQGIVSQNLYDQLSLELNKLSLGPVGMKFFIQMKLEKQIKPGVYDTYFESSEDIAGNTSRKGSVLDRPLDTGDKVTIYVEDRARTLFSRISTAGLLRIVSGEQHISAMKTAIVANPFPDTVAGYDVIADLNTNPFTTVNRITVITKVNISGRAYNTPTVLPGYKTYAVTDASDPNYIFPEGKFVRSEDVIAGTRVIVYAQKY